MAVGLVLGFILFECSGIVAGGLVSPGYFALYWDRPGTIALALGVALLTLTFLRILGSFTLLYGRRRFVVALLTGFFIQWCLGGMLLGSGLAMSSSEIVGYLIPGLVGHEMDRQGVALTLVALLLLSSLTRVVLQLAGFL